MTFELLKEEEIRTDYYVFTHLRLLRIPPELTGRPHSAVISELMNSPFHLWQGEEYPDGFSITWTWERDGKMVTQDIENVKVFGPYDVQQLSPADYQPLHRTDLEPVFFSFISEYTHQDESYIDQVRQRLSGYVDGDDWSFYHLAISPDDNTEKRSPYLDVFSFFKAVLAIHSQRAELLLVEFGQD